ncbi:FAD/NAD-P-binding domain-containing protein [Gymnopus androsaceus JB14]|uniref:FAD/NAD-P-binding domain-containing protein n=1 Tax=Gymnopus androsaceus JB14 TaxID=1447944 RepID=A0A6A4GPL4_9AGAR|nr:FAD/NAD-P-binding domain-containing protein [Gymnopus androsaceus JB14]
MSDPKASSVGILGSGAAGLITAYTLLQDGFKNVTIITRDSSPGGVWSDERVYPGLTLNNVYGEFRFSPQPSMAPKDDSKRLSGFEMRDYMQKFAETYLKGAIRYGLRILGVARPKDTSSGWDVRVEDVRTREHQILKFDKVVLCTGGCSEPYIPEELSLASANSASFKGPIFHSSQFPSRLAKLQAEGKDESTFGDVVIVGGGKSAQDMAAYLANKATKVSVVFETADAFLAVTSPLPDAIRRSRFLSILSPHSSLNSRLERFLHTTSLGSKITHFIWDKIIAGSFNAAGITNDSPLKNTHDAFWGVRINDEGVPRPDGFHMLVKTGKIHVIAPARVASYSYDGESVILNNGGKLKADTVILATGYTSSWHPIFDEQTSIDLGLNRHPPSSSLIKTEKEWNEYVSLSNPPEAHPSSEQWASSIYRGIIPAKNLLKRDFAINGAIFTTNNGYAFEVTAHWISSYFLNDANLKIPSSPEEALAHAERNSAWLRKRYPDMLLWANESYSSNLAFWTWPQTIDELLNDLGLRIYRSGGNWLTWPFKVIELKEIENLKQERDDLRLKMKMERAA